jgi:head-tail adaptor
MRPDPFHAGDRTELLTFQLQTFTENAEGQVTGTWRDIFQEWADAERRSETTASFEIDYRDGLSPKTHRVIFDGAYWNLTSVLHDRNRRSTRLDCDFSMMIEVTSLDSDGQREFIVGLPVIHP